MSSPNPRKIEKQAEMLKSAYLRRLNRETMNWIKKQIEAQAKADQEEKGRRQKQAEEDATKAKELANVSHAVFSKLIEAIQADIERLNEAKQGAAERFSFHTDGRTTFDFYKIGEAEKPRLILASKPIEGHIQYEQVEARGRRHRAKGHIDVSINPNGKPRLTVMLPHPTFEPAKDYSYEELSQFLLSPTF